MRRRVGPSAADGPLAAGNAIEMGAVEDALSPVLRLGVTTR